MTPKDILVKASKSSCGRVFFWFSFPYVFRVDPKHAICCPTIILRRSTNDVALSDSTNRANYRDDMSSSSKSPNHDVGGNCIESDVVVHCLWKHYLWNEKIMVSNWNFLKRGPPGKKKRIVGAHDPEEHDRKFGRKWRDKGSSRRPNLYSKIGQPCPPPGTKPTLFFEGQKASRNWLNLVRSQHRKRWPLHFGLSIAFFAEFTSKVWHRMNLYETCAMLPGFGVGCTFWKPNYTRGPRKGGWAFLLEHIDWQVRPFAGSMSGSTLFRDTLIRKNMAPLGKSYTGWNFCFPPRESKDRWIFRPPFPKLLHTYEPTYTATSRGKRSQ